MAIINSFKGDYAFLSNFWPSVVVYEGEEYATVEAAYQAAKTDRPELRLAVRLARTPGISKKEGRKLPLRAFWDDMKLSVMDELLHQKFTDEVLRERLLQTGSDLLIEGNEWGDTYWGICHGIGANNLGRLLMRLRREIQKTFF